MSVLFVGKMGDVHCENAKEFVDLNFPEAISVLGKRSDPLPEECKQWSGNYIFSYLSPWIIPEDLLKRVEIASINFHPGPPEYPGIGCTNFAIYNQEPSYGVTCHHMAAKVDTGKIIAVRRFPVLSSDTVYTLTQRCYVHIAVLFYEILSGIVQGVALPECKERWKRKPYKRSELDALCKISPEMSSGEITRRVRAVTFPGAPGVYTEIDGIRFELPESAEIQRSGQ